MVNNVIGWPVEVISLVSGINISLMTIKSLISVCQSEGILRHNYGIIIELLPRLLEEANTIYGNAKMIRAEAPRRRGRPAKWVAVTENIIALAIKLIDAAGDIRDQIPGNYWSTAALLLSIMDQTINQIGAEIDQITFDGVPEVFLEALDDEKN